MKELWLNRTSPIPLEQVLNNENCSQISNIETLDLRSFVSIYDYLSVFKFKLFSLILTFFKF